MHLMVLPRRRNRIERMFGRLKDWRRAQPVMTAIARRSGWVMLQINLILGTGDLEGAGMEFRTIVRMTHFGNAPRWPLRTDPARRKPVRFVRHNMGQAQHGRGTAWARHSATAKSDGGSNGR